MSEEELILIEVRHRFVVDEKLMAAGADASMGPIGERTVDEDFVKGAAGFCRAVAKADGGIDFTGIATGGGKIVFKVPFDAGVLAGKGLEVSAQVEGAGLADEFIAVEGKDPIGTVILEGEVEEVIGEGGLLIDGVEGAEEAEGEALVPKDREYLRGGVVAAMIDDKMVIDEGCGVPDEGLYNVLLIADESDGNQAGRVGFPGEKVLERFQGSK
jgi:hypothetical protein